MVTSLFTLSKIKMIVINDLMYCVYNSGETEEVFTKHVHHRKLSILYIFKS